MQRGDRSRRLVPRQVVGATPAPSASASAQTPQSTACPADMVLASGKFCPQVEQECIKHTRDYEEEQEMREEKRKKGETVPPARAPERCVIYNKPSVCRSKERVPMRFCNLTLEEMNEAMNRGWEHLDSRVPMKLQLERAGVAIACDPAAVQAVLDADKAK